MRRIYLVVLLCAACTRQDTPPPAQQVKIEPQPLKPAWADEIADYDKIADWLLEHNKKVKSEVDKIKAGHLADIERRYPTWTLSKNDALNELNNRHRQTVEQWTGKQHILIEEIHQKIRALYMKHNYDKQLTEEGRDVYAKLLRIWDIWMAK